MPAIVKNPATTNASDPTITGREPNLSSHRPINGEIRAAATPNVSAVFICVRDQPKWSSSGSMNTPKA